jgi:transposase
MMGRKHREQASLFYEFRLEDMIPKGHLLRRIDVFVTSVLGDLHEQLGPFYSDIGRPSIDPELLIRMLIIGYCFGIRSERKLCEEVRLHLAYRWFCRLDLNDAVPHHSTFSENRLNRFRESDILRHIFERVVIAAMAMGLVKGEGFAVDASVMEANASRYHGKAPHELDWTEKQQRKRAMAEYLAALEAEAVADGDAPNDNESGGPEGKRQRYERQPPKVISPSDPQSAWTAKANKRVQFGYGLNYLIDIKNAVIVDVDATPARTYDEVAATRTMLDRTEERFDLKPRRLAADTAYGTGKFLGWLVKEKKIIPHIPVWEMSDRQDGIFSRSDFHWDRKRGAYICPNGKLLKTSGTVHDGRTLLYRASKRDATCAQYERSAAPRRMRARSRATCMRMPATPHDGR